MNSRTKPREDGLLSFDDEMKKLDSTLRKLIDGTDLYEAEETKKRIEGNQLHEEDEEPTVERERRMLTDEEIESLLQEGEEQKELCKQALFIKIDEMTQEIPDKRIRAMLKKKTAAFVNYHT